MFSSTSKHLNHSFKVLNNSALNLPVKDFSYGVLECSEILKNSNVVTPLFLLFFRSSIQVFPLYFPMNSRPSYEGKEATIKWLLRLYKENKLTEEYNITLYNYSIYFETNPKININEVRSINLYKNKENNITIIFDENMKINDIKIIFYEKINEKNNIIISKDLDFIQDKNELLIKIQANEFPGTYRGVFSALSCEILMNTSKTVHKIPLEVYDFFIGDFFRFENKLEELVFSYLAKNGPMNLGSLVAKINSQEKLRVKSAELKRTCIKMLEEGYIIKNEKDWNTATYYLNSSICDKFVKG